LRATRPRYPQFSLQELLTRRILVNRGSPDSTPVAPDDCGRGARYRPMPTIRVAQRPAPHRQDARFGANRMIPPGEQKIVPATLAAFSRIRPIPQTEALCETIPVHPLWVQSYPIRVHRQERQATSSEHLRLGSKTNTPSQISKKRSSCISKDFF